MTPTQHALARAKAHIARIQARLTIALKYDNPDDIKREIIAALNMLGIQKGDQ